MGWEAVEGRRGTQFLILSTQGGVRGERRHPGRARLPHGPLGGRPARPGGGGGTRPARRRCRSPRTVSDPCDGRTQGTPGMFDSLPYRNDAAIVFRRLVRSLAHRRGVIGVGTCDKGLPAMMMALASFRNLAGAIVPGGVTLPPRRGRGRRRSADRWVRASRTALVSPRARRRTSAAGPARAPAAAASSSAPRRRRRWSPRRSGLTVPHAALAPSGQPIWLDVARRTAQAVHEQWRDGRTLDRAC